MKFTDRLYDDVVFDKQTLRWLQSSPFVRLRHISLSVVPSWAWPAGTCASKSEHSIGVMHLAQIACRNQDLKEYRREIVAAALLHDLATPPFSHGSEYYQILLTGKNHEESVSDFVVDTDLDKLLNKDGIDVDLVYRLIAGKEEPLSDIINGTIDLDNLDNTLRFGLSIGLIRRPNYEPHELAKAFRISDNQLQIQVKDIKPLVSWLECRQQVYEFVYSPPNLSPAVMLMRALYYAHQSGEIKPNFFQLTDEAAWTYLKENCNPITKSLVEDIDRWKWYQKVYEYQTTAPSTIFQDLCQDFTNRDKLANLIAEQIGVLPQDICVFLRQDKGHKDIHAPIYTFEGEPLTILEKRSLRYIAQVYAKNDGKMIEERVRETMDMSIGNQ